MMECISKQSKYCTNVGYPQWGGRCCNCEDEYQKPFIRRAKNAWQTDKEAENRERQEMVESMRHPNG